VTDSEPTPGRSGPPRAGDLLLLLALGAALNLLVWARYAPRLSFSDEIVYAVTARNIATGRGLVAGHTHALSILEKGHPLLYVHMPGHPILMAASFALLGASDEAALLPSRLSYVAVGLLLYGLGVWLQGRAAGLIAAILFYVYPLVLSLANTAMSELTLALLTTLYLALWLRARESLRWWWGGALAVALAAGVVHHETFLAMLPATLYLFVAGDRGRRSGAALAFGATFAILLAAVVWPLSQARAPHPSYATNLSDLGTPGAIAAALARNVAENLAGLVRSRGGASGTLRTQLPWLLLLAVVLPGRRLTGSARHALVFATSAFAFTFLGLAPVYPVARVGPRPLLHLLPPILLVAGVLLARIRPRALRAAVVFAAVAGSAAASAADVETMMRSQEGSFRRESRYSLAIRELTRGRSPRAVLVDEAFLYGWDAYPVEVVTFARALDGAGFDELDRRLPIDVAALRGAREPGAGEAGEPPPLAPHLLSRGYALAGVRDGIWVYLGPPLRGPEGRAQPPAADGRRTARSTPWPRTTRLAS
jgi:4-amino-4-deoxy-L-arabinose transferase-like glycosyltransferase